jgi:3-phenylpropionate/cinnamic acid dioxygenase small subunit
MSVGTDTPPSALPFDIELRTRVDDFYARYAEVICDDELERWPDFFVEECLYKIIPRVNHERALPVSLILAESRGGVIDRMTAIRNTMVFAPRYLSHVVSLIRIVDVDGGHLATRSTLTVYETISEQATTLLIAARTFDKIAIQHNALKFVERVVICDTEQLPSTLIYPL